MIYTVTFNPAVDYVLRLPSLNGGTEPPQKKYAGAERE